MNAKVSNAQAGAVAYIKQSTLDKLPGCKYIEAAVFPGIAAAMAAQWGAVAQEKAA